MVKHPPANQMTVPQKPPLLIKLTSLHDFRHEVLLFRYQNIDYVDCLTQTNKNSLVNPIKHNSFWSCIALFTEPFLLPFTPPLHSLTVGSFGSWPFKQLLWNPLLQHSQNTKSESFPTFPHIFEIETKKSFPTLQTASFCCSNSFTEWNRSAQSSSTSRSRFGLWNAAYAKSIQFMFVFTSATTSARHRSTQNQSINTMFHTLPFSPLLHKSPRFLSLQ